MGLSINTFFHQAGLEPGEKQVDQSVILRGNGELAKTSAFSVFQGHARARENDATAAEFLDAVANDPVYRQCLTTAEDVLGQCREPGKRLTTGHIATVKAHMDSELSRDLGQAVAFGQRLANEGLIPEGSGTSFGLFCTRHGALAGEAVPGELLRDFLKDEVVGQHVAKLCRTRNMGDDATTVHAILDKTGALNQGLNLAMDGHGLDAKALRFTDIMSVLDDSIAKTMDVLQDLHAAGASLQELKDAPDADAMLRTLVHAVDVEAVDRVDVGTLYMSIRMEAKNVSTAEGRSDAVRSFQLNTLGSTVGAGVMTELGLPENLGSPLAHHPDVQSEARTALSALVAPPAVPTKEQARIALDGALRAFMGTRSPLVRDFVAMAANPPVELKPKALSLSTLPRFINVLLEEDAMLDPLLGKDPQPDFLQRVGRHSHVVESCTHGMTGDFGSDDFLNVQAGAIQLLLARRDVKPEQYKDILRMAVEKFGPIASELTTVSLSCGGGSLRGPGVLGLHLASLGAYRALETHMTVMLRLVPEEVLVDMNVQGKDHRERCGNFLEQHFQREVPLEELSDTSRQFVRGHGVMIDDMTETVRARLDGVTRSRQDIALADARHATFDAVFDEFFPRGSSNIEENPVMFLTAFDEAERTMDLAGIDPDKVRAGSMFLAAREVSNKWMETHPGPVDSASLRGVVMNSIAESLGNLKTTLNGIDALPEPQERLAEQGEFSSREKGIMKDMAMATGLRDVDLIVRLAETARDKASGMTMLCRDYNTAKNLSEGIQDLASASMPLMRHLNEHPVPNMEEALGGMLMMAVGFSDLSREELNRLFASLNEDLGQQVSGAFNFCNIANGAAQPSMLMATRVMEELHMDVGNRLDIHVERGPFFFHQSMPELGDINGDVMANVNRLRPGSFSGLDVSLGRVVPPLSTTQRKTLYAIAAHIDTSSPEELRFMIPYLMQGNARTLLAAQAANGDRPLSAAQIWRAVAGHSAPLTLRDGDLGRRLLEHVTTSYDRALSIACPDMHPTMREHSVLNSLTMGISFPRLMELTQPGARLTQDDVTIDLGMSSLRGYGPENAYGLTTDFRRRGQNTVMSLESVDGRGMQTQPFDISDAENVPAHPQFIALIDHARSVTVSSGQMARTLQAFSQAALIMPRVLSAAFPGIHFSEHGNFSVTAVQRDDNAVTVDIDSDPALPLSFHQRYVINSDGDHRCTEFVMERR